MPIDPDAYMSGAIPGLSRGGSWVPPAHPGHPANGTAINPHPLSKTGTSSAAPPSQLESGGMANPWINSRYFPSGPFSFIPGAHHAPSTHHGLHPASVLGPLQHPGWAWSQAQPSVAGNPVGSATFPMSESGTILRPRQATPSTVSPALIPHTPVPMSVASGGRYRDGSFVWEGGSWERHGGAPKPTTREPEYVRPVPEPYVQHGRPIGDTPATIVHRRRAESLPPVPEPNATGSLTERERRDRRARHETDRERTASGSELELEGRKRAIGRPSIIKRRSSEQDLPQIARHVQREVALDHSNRSPPSRLNSKVLSRMARIDTTVVPPPLGPLKTFPTSTISTASPYTKLMNRPHISRRHTHNPGSPSSSPSTRGPPLSTTDSASHFAHQRARLLSAPNPPSTRSTAQGSIIDWTSTDGELSPNGAHSPKSRFGLSDLSATLPSHTMRPRTKADAPPGYVSPTSHDTYDRYAAHPAAPPPDRVDRYLNNPTSLTQETGIQPSQYVPIGYATPTREIGWNRDGPAMKTHGVAWNRHTAGMVLPEIPEGPRWIQARPPRDDMVSGGAWWESGGQGH